MLYGKEPEPEPGKGKKYLEPELVKRGPAPQHGLGITPGRALAHWGVRIRTRSLL